MCLTYLTLFTRCQKRQKHMICTWADLCPKGIDDDNRKIPCESSSQDFQNGNQFREDAENECPLCKYTRDGSQPEDWLKEKRITFIPEANIVPKVDAAAIVNDAVDEVREEIWTEEVRKVYADEGIGYKSYAPDPSKVKETVERLSAQTRERINKLREAALQQPRWAHLQQKAVDKVRTCYERGIDFWQVMDVSLGKEQVRQQNVESKKRQGIALKDEEEHPHVLKVKDISKERYLFCWEDIGMGRPPKAGRSRSRPKPSSWEDRPKNMLPNLVEYMKNYVPPTQDDQAQAQPFPTDSRKRAWSEEQDDDDEGERASMPSQPGWERDTELESEGHDATKQTLQDTGEQRPRKRRGGVDRRDFGAQASPFPDHTQQRSIIRQGAMREAPVYASPSSHVDDQFSPPTGFSPLSNAGRRMYPYYSSTEASQSPKPLGVQPPNLAYGSRTRLERGKYPTPGPSSPPAEPFPSPYDTRIHRAPFNAGNPIARHFPLNLNAQQPLPGNTASPELVRGYIAQSTSYPRQSTVVRSSTFPQGISLAQQQAMYHWPENAFATAPSAFFPPRPEPQSAPASLGPGQHQFDGFNISSSHQSIGTFGPYGLDIPHGLRSDEGIEQSITATHYAAVEPGRSNLAPVAPSYTGVPDSSGLSHPITPHLDNDDDHANEPDPHMPALDVTLSLSAEEYPSGGHNSPALHHPTDLLESIQALHADNQEHAIDPELDWLNFEQLDTPPSGHDDLAGEDET
ncbi:MAG: hypothetical protein M1820_007147 [Bogoriella megaspora]|nr:MAG: hypothetical protein M1820_007147 [Bogoriella megaspora]